MSALFVGALGFSALGTRSALSQTHALMAGPRASADLRGPVTLPHPWHSSATMRGRAGSSERPHPARRKHASSARRSLPRSKSFARLTPTMRREAAPFTYRYRALEGG